MTLTEQLLKVSDVYSTVQGLSRARVSTIVLNRGSTLGSIAEGKADVTTGTFERAMLWFSVNWPADAAWPTEVMRPIAEAAT